MTLSLAIATHGPDGPSRVARMLLAPHPYITYVVSWQNHGDAPLPPSLLRPDVAVHRFGLPGLSRNRNNAVSRCASDIVLIADDDVAYSLPALLELIGLFSADPSLQLTTVIVRMPGSKVYPAMPCPLSLPLPRGYWASSVEIAFRRNAPRLPAFHPLLGLGAPELTAAEDEVFLLSAIRRGLVCRFFPLVIGTHPAQSTGSSSALTSGTLMAQGLCIRLYTPRLWPLRLLMKAYRLRRAANATFLPVLRALWRGALKAPGLPDPDGRYL